jgi:hypothetical protein
VGRTWVWIGKETEFADAGFAICGTGQKKPIPPDNPPGAADAVGAYVLKQLTAFSFGKIIADIS